MFYNRVVREDRSRMNVTFFLKDESLNATFLQGAEKEGMVQLRGHRSAGGMRASMYNAMPLQSVQRLRDYMYRFEKEHA
jgi:phosphoserine aminotransferase